MHPTIAYELSKARIADLHRAAGQDAIIHATRQARSTAAAQPAGLAAALAHRLLSLSFLHSRSASGPARPLPACPSSAACTACC